MFCDINFSLFYDTFVLSFEKNAPGGDLIRVDLIRFPGSIPGDTQMCPN